MNYPSQSKPWWVLGAGSIGCLWAFRLLERGHDVRLVVHSSERLRQLNRAGGITLVDAGKRQTRLCAGHTASDTLPPITQLLITSKAHQTDKAFASIAQRLQPDATVLLVQNGLGVAEQLLARRPDIRLFCAITTSGAHLLSPFEVQCAGLGSTQLGRYPREPGLTTGQALVDALVSDSLPIEAQAAIYRAQWYKLAVNCVINPLTALFDLRNGEILRYTEAALLARALCEEVAAVSQAQGIDLSGAALYQTVSAVCQQTAANISSMLQDVRQRRATEIDYINGYLQRVATSHGVACPTNDALLSRISSMAPNAQ